jgi:hypothetical protein
MRNGNDFIEDAIDLPKQSWSCSFSCILREV